MAVRKTIVNLCFQVSFLMIFNFSDPNWWKGETYQGVGLFPSNFVTADLTAEPEMSEYTDTYTLEKKNP